MAHSPTHPIPDPLNLVLLDDSAASSRLIKEQLKDAQIANTLSVVRTPDELLVALHDENIDPLTQPDVLLLNTRLSTGYADEFLAELTTHPSVTPIPVVLLAQTEHEAEFITKTTEHPFPILTNPPDPNDLLDLLRAEENVGLSVVKQTGD